jgi:hypothetical protein
MVRVALEFGKITMDMMAAVNALDFERAKADLDRLEDDIIPEALGHEPLILSWRYAPGFTERFWGGTVESGYERVTGGNEIAARLPDEWLFMLDPLDGGEDLGLWKPQIGTGSWAPLKTWSQSWSNQGLRYYKGVGWYRTTVAVPARFEGRKLGLWLGGVDDQAQAWINGRELPVLVRGAAPSGRPWDFDAADAVRFGAPNVIVVKVSNKNVDELGTGGLTGPAMLWAEGGDGSEK